MYIKVLTYISICFLIAGINVNAQVEVKNLEILLDNNDQYSPNNILNHVHDTLFKPHSFEITDIKIKCTYWLKFNLDNPQKVSGVLFAPYIAYPKISLYSLDSNKISEQTTGNSLTFDQRSFKTRDLILKIPIKPDYETYYIKCTSYFYTDYMFHFIDPVDLAEGITKETNQDYFFFGFSSLSIIFSIILLFYFREALYLYYFLFSIMLFCARLIDSGYIYDFSLLHNSSSIYSLYRVYTVLGCFTLVFAIMYLMCFVRLKENNLKLYRWVLVLVGMRIAYFIFHYSFPLIDLPDNHVDLGCILICVGIIIYSIQFDCTIGILALISALIVSFAYFYYIFSSLIFKTQYPFSTYVLVSNLEVVIFCISIVYRYFVENKEKQNMLSSMNQNLELQVAERTKKLEVQTEEIKKMNILLQQNNIVLEKEVAVTSKARLLQKSMSYNEFLVYFPNNESCLTYLSNIKWPNDQSYKCVNCGYGNYKEMQNSIRKCRKCNHIESPTVNTLFKKVKFPLTKAFYITYLSCQGDVSGSVDIQAKLLEMRVATYWSFKQKVLLLIEKTKTKKKHKDGWTHLIEYSITRNEKKNLQIP
jgi:hypothetical protein